MKIRTAILSDSDEILREDHWIAADELHRKIEAEQVLVLEFSNGIAGFLRYGMFWDNTPFCYMLRIKEAFRGQGYGRKLISVWEEQMRQMGYQAVMTSTSASEQAQHFYQKLGYQAVGSFLPPGEPLELIFVKAF